MSIESVEFDAFLEDFCRHELFNHSPEWKKALISEIRSEISPIASFRTTPILLDGTYPNVFITKPPSLVDRSYPVAGQFVEHRQLRANLCDGSRPKESLKIPDAVRTLEELSRVWRLEYEAITPANFSGLTPDRCMVNEITIVNSSISDSYDVRISLACNERKALLVYFTGSVFPKGPGIRHASIYPVPAILSQRQLVATNHRGETEYLPNLRKFTSEFGDRKYGEIRAVIERKAYDQEDQVLFFAGISISREFVRVIVPIVLLGLQMFTLMHIINLRLTMEHCRGSPISAEVKFFPWMGIYTTRLAIVSTFVINLLFPVALITVIWLGTEDGGGAVTALFIFFVVVCGVNSNEQISKIRKLIAAAEVK